MMELESLKKLLLFIIERHNQIKCEKYIPYNGNSGFICKKDNDWYKYRGGA